MPRTSWAEMARYTIALPDQAVAQAFTEQVSAIILRLLASIHESRTVAALPDALLPKLISGELQVNRGERLVAEAVQRAISPPAPIALNGRPASGRSH